MYAVYAYIGEVLGVNVGIYGIHGVFGVGSCADRFSKPIRSPREGIFLSDDVDDLSWEDDIPAHTCTM